MPANRLLRLHSFQVLVTLWFLTSKNAKKCNILKQVNNIRVRSLQIYSVLEKIVFDCRNIASIMTRYDLKAEYSASSYQRWQYCIFRCKRFALYGRFTVMNTHINLICVFCFNYVINLRNKLEVEDNCFPAICLAVLLAAYVM